MSAIAAAVHVVVDKEPHGNPILMWVPAATAIISLAATLAAWFAVKQARKIWQASLEPVLVPMLDQGSDTILLRVLNVSDTVAADAGWAVLWSHRRNEGRLPDRSLRGGGDTEPFQVLDMRGTDADDGHPAMAIVWCRDRRGNVFVWATDGTTKEYEREKVRGKQPVDLLADACLAATFPVRWRWLPARWPRRRRSLPEDMDPRHASYCGVAGEYVDPL